MNNSIKYIFILILILGSCKTPQTLQNKELNLNNKNMCRYIQNGDPPKKYVGTVGKNKNIKVFIREIKK
jgi:hypothetical protein